MAILGHGLRPRPHRRNPRHRSDAHRSRSEPPLSQARKCQSLGLAQGPPGANHDRGGRGRGAAEARRHDRRSHRRQYRARPGLGRCPQGLSHAAGGAGQDGTREGAACQGNGRRGRHHTLGRRQGACRLLSGPRRGDHAAHAGRILRQSVRQSGQSASTRSDDRPGDPPSDGRGRRRRRGRCRLRRNFDRDRPLPAAGFAQDRDDPRRSRSSPPMSRPDE